MKLKVVDFISIIAKSVLEYIVFGFIVVVGAVAADFIIEGKQFKLMNAIDLPPELCVSFFLFIQFGGLTWNKIKM